MFEVSYDAAEGLITCISAGFHRIEEVGEHIRILRSVVECSKREINCARILVLTRKSVVQSTEVIEAASRALRETLAAIGPADRIAFVFSSSLPRMQASRNFDPERARTFLSEQEARTWLMEDRDRRSAIVPAQACATS